MKRKKLSKIKNKDNEIDAESLFFDFCTLGQYWTDISPRNSIIRLNTVIVYISMPRGHIDVTSPLEQLNMYLK